MKLFNRQGILQHTSEYIAGLEKNIAWKPSGFLIASSQMLPNKHSIIFFEKNGLKHGEFDLSYSPNSYMIDKLCWSNDSEILLVCAYEILLVDENYTKNMQNIILFIQSNYYWYQKQKLTFNNTNYVENILWDEQQYSLLHFVYLDGTYCSQLYKRTINATSEGTVLVIDGNCLHISDYERTLIPPPMSNYNISFEDQIKQICHSDNFLAVFLCNDQIIILNLISITLSECITQNYPISYKFENVFADFGQVYMPVFYKKIQRISEIILPIFFENDRIFGLIDNKIVCFSYKQYEEICWLADISDSISALSVLSDKQLLLASVNGQLYFYDIDGNSCQVSDLSRSKKFYDDCPTCLWVHKDNFGKSHIIALTARNSLYYDQNLIMGSVVSSVTLYCNQYLLFTTLDNLFYCWPLHEFDTCKLNAAQPRALERGSKIITTSRSQAKVVLQLPRGNLEAFHPHSLLLNQVEQYVNEFKFFQAFKILRKNRINFNYICDYNFDFFKANINLFLEQIGQDHVDWICLFLSDLSNENCYSVQNNQLTNKVDTICELLLQKMRQMDQIKFINPILLTYIKREKPEIDRALQVVKDLPSSKLREGAIKFLLYVVNVNKLFDEALGTYDFDIFLMVAAMSNKDPKEYLSMVNAFKEIEDENYRKYKIDMLLHRYKSALLHLSNCANKYNEALELIEEKRLFKEAIEIYKLNSSPENSSKYSEIWNLYGEYLFKKKYYHEAAIAFKKAFNYPQAFKMYLMFSNWNMASVCAKKMSQTKEDFKKLLHSVSQHLILNNHYTDGAYILEHYLNDFKEAFLTLVRGHQWDQAIRCFYDHDLEQSLFDNELKLELTNVYESMMENIESTLIKSKDHIARLQELKNLRLNQNQSHFTNQIDADFDAYSDTSSLFDSASTKSSESALSNSSLKTNRTNTKIKNLKRLEQKKYFLKRGSPNEDIQIVFTIKELVCSSENLFTESISVISTLYELYMVSESATLQQKLYSLHSQMSHAIDFIWNSEYFKHKLSEGIVLLSFYFLLLLTFNF